ncbi:sensor histidine kinase [Dactylosporangium sp. CA-233914]|uniref:sensor histidine kinase n=1 Tax=Dactylosporangium sp. CA-233914 TaxID=3239934 RepID=UPI003D8A9614
MALPRWHASARTRIALDALERLVGGLGTGILALVALLTVVVTMAACLIGVGLLIAPFALRLLRVVADRERDRLSRTGPEILGHLPAPTRVRDAVTDPAVRREVAWAAVHGSAGLFLGILAISLPVNVLRDGTFALWWRLLPESGATSSIGFPVVHDQTGALVVSALGLVWLALVFFATPCLARLQEWPGRRLLAPAPGTDLMLRVAELTATRAAALDAHATELRRIERALHDGTQNRIVAVNVLLGAARRAVARDPATADEILERAQGAAEAALADLRAVVRTILPPVLTDRSLPDALRSLAATCPTPVAVDAELPVRCAASVEATAYFVAAEALTNVAKHSGAEHAELRLRRVDGRLELTVTDDGRGGADAGGGSGLAGIRQRAEAHDGTVDLTSPPGGPTILKVSLPCGS